MAYRMEMNCWARVVGTKMNPCDCNLDILLLIVNSLTLI